MQHETLPGVPRICEVCFAALDFGGFWATQAWPGTFGQTVYVCRNLTCSEQAMRVIRPRRHREAPPLPPAAA